MSIRQQLTSLIISTVILASFLAALHGYKNSLRQLDSIFDQELKSIARVILGVADQLDAMPEHMNSEIVFQVIEDGALSSASNNSPDHIIAGEAGTFGIKVFFGKRWRTFTLNSPTLNSPDISVVVAHPIETRSNSAEDILLATLLPIIIAIPIIAILIFYFINKSLGSLFSLSRQLKQKNSNDLSEVTIDSPPKELIPVIGRLNNLLTRLSKAFEREKQLSANAAHELRTPVSVLSLTAHNIEREFTNGSLTKELIDELYQNIERQAHVIEQMIALYRFSPEQFDKDLETANLHKVIQEVISNNYEHIDTNNQNISLEGQICSVEGDYFALYTLFENIIRNSIKYSGNGSQILVSILQNEGTTTVSIEDSGAGLDEAELSKVFNRFYRSENDASRVKGSGLGLSIVSYIAALHKCDVSCSRSELGGLKTEVVFKTRDGEQTRV